MEIFDYIIILIFILFAYFGFLYGSFKMLSDIISFFFASIFSKLITSVLFSLLYQYLPFFNFYGKTKGIKSINIIVWQLIIYVLVFLIIILIINQILKVTKLKQKLTDSMVESNIISNILGIFISVIFSFIITFNVIILLLAPCFNLSYINDSKFAKTIVQKVPILSSINRKMYLSEVYAINRINKKDNTDSKYKKVNNDIIKYMVKVDLISSEKVNKLNKKNKLVGKRKTVADEILEESYLTD